MKAFFRAITLFLLMISLLGFGLCGAGWLVSAVVNWREGGWMLGLLLASVSFGIAYGVWKAYESETRHEREGDP